MSNEIPFLWRGWSFPPEFNRATKSVKMSEGADDIKESLEILLGTKVGERLISPGFGCNLNHLQFEPLTASLEKYVEELIRTSILRYEPRINLEDIHFEDASKDGVIYINIRYIIRTTNSRANMVYPFYLKEGTNL